MKIKNTITFDSSAKKFIIMAFDFKKGHDGMLYHKSSGPIEKLVLDIYGKPIAYKRFAGVVKRKGKVQALSGNICELIQLHDEGVL
jgi:hypothetical protein